MTLVTWSDGDRDASNVFEAVVPNERWNGHAMPWFAGSEAERIAEDCATTNKFGPQFRYVESSDSWEATPGDEYEEHGIEWIPVATTEIAGVKMHRMGDGWTWQEIECPAVDESDEWSVEAREEWDALYREVRDAQRSMRSTTERNFVKVAGK